MGTRRRTGTETGMRIRLARDHRHTKSDIMQIGRHHTDSKTLSYKYPDII
jgi:hypothetical protein